MPALAVDVHLNVPSKLLDVVFSMAGRVTVAYKPGNLLRLVCHINWRNFSRFPPSLRNYSPIRNVYVGITSVVGCQVKAKQIIVLRQALCVRRCLQVVQRPQLTGRSITWWKVFCVQVAPVENDRLCYGIMCSVSWEETSWILCKALLWTVKHTLVIVRTEDDMKKGIALFSECVCWKIRRPEKAQLDTVKQVNVSI